MRVERLRVDAFGRLAAIDTGEEALPGLLVVRGPNESGKSTLFHFFLSMLYGFYPASRDTNPYAPWGGAEPSGSLVLRLDSGECVDVERRLLSQPTGRLAFDGRSEELRNRTVPWAEHVPRAVFRQVFALTLTELAGLDDETWGRVQDRIVGSMGATDLRPARAVIAELEQEAGELWRPTRRGHQRIRENQRAILALRSRRLEAAERDRRLRDVVNAAEGARARLHEAREARHRARLAAERVQALVPVRAQLRRIETLREEAGPADDLHDMPADPAVELSAMEERIAGLERRLAELRAERSEPEAAVSAFGDPERNLLERGKDVTRLLTRAAGLGSDRARLAALDQESRDLQRRLAAATATVLSLPWEDAQEDLVAGVSVVELRERVRMLEAARRERRILEAARRGLPPSTASGGATLVAGVTTLVAGVLVLLVGRATHGVGVTVAGALASVMGLGLLALWQRGRRRWLLAGEGDSESALRSAAEVERAARSAVTTLVDGLPVLPSLLEEPGDGLVSGVERVQDLLRDRAERASAARETEERIADVDAEAKELAAALGMDSAPGAETVAHLLDRESRRAERTREAAAAASRELHRLEREARRTEEELGERVAARDRLRARLAQAGDGDVGEGARRLRERIRAAERARQLLEELEHAHPDLDVIRERIHQAEATGESWTTDDDDLAHRKARVEELNDEVETLAARAQALERDIAHLREAETVDAVDGELAALQEEEQALLLERDRRWLLAHLVRQADRRFREEHQPDLLRRASAYLENLTGGRYDRVVADEAAGKGSFYVAGPGLGEPVVLAPPISTGTLEQAYLALRLAIVDHLDQGHERLPLFMDEVLVNWDGERRARGMKLLAEVARSRQVFVFTCSPELARGLESEGALVLPIGDAA